MQIMQVPVPPVANTSTQPQTVANTLPHVLTQAVAPISQQALSPAEKMDRANRSRGRGEKQKREDLPKEAPEGRGGHVNISV